MVSDLHNAFFAEVVDGIDEVAREQGFDMIINTGGRSPARERRALRSLLSFRPAGLILLSPVVPAAAIGQAAEQLPVVLVARSSRLSTVDTVNDDGERGSTVGGRSPGVVGAQAHRASGRRRGHAGRASSARVRRRDGGARARAAGGAAASTPTWPARGGPLVAGDDLPTAILSCNDFNAVGAISALEDAGLRVPQDVSVVGYDNTSLAALRHVSLTTIDQPRAEFGRLAADALLQRVRGERAGARAPPAAPVSGRPLDHRPAARAGLSPTTPHGARPPAGLLARSPAGGPGLGVHLGPFRFR